MQRCKKCIDKSITSIEQYAMAAGVTTLKKKGSLKFIPEKSTVAG
jgi:hypothetical protein